MIFYRRTTAKSTLNSQETEKLAGRRQTKALFTFTGSEAAAPAEFAVGQLVCEVFFRDKDKRGKQRH